MESPEPLQLGPQHRAEELIAQAEEAQERVRNILDDTDGSGRHSSEDEREDEAERAKKKSSA